MPVNPGDGQPGVVQGSSSGYYAARQQRQAGRQGRLPAAEACRNAGSSSPPTLPARPPCAARLQVKCSLLILDLPAWEELVVGMFTTLLDVVK